MKTLKITHNGEKYVANYFSQGKTCCAECGTADNGWDYSYYCKNCGVTEYSIFNSSKEAKDELV